MGIQFNESSKIKQTTGMEVGKQHFFKCSSCDKPLIDIIVNYPKVDTEWNVAVECCYCGGQSYEQIIRGMFIVGTNDEVKLSDIDYNSDPIIVRTIKAKS
jgi:hypothetical protein